MSDARLTHINEAGEANMVDVGAKPDTQRMAVAGGQVHLNPETVDLIRKGLMKKGDVLSVAKIAGIMAAKKTWELIPLCHPLRLTGIEIDFLPDTTLSQIRITALVRALDRTGVEMEALVAVTHAALTIYDMCKAIDRGMTIQDVRLTFKNGGKSGLYQRSK